MSGQLAISAATQVDAGAGPASVHWNASELARASEAVPLNVLSLPDRGRQLATPGALGQQFSGLLHRFQEHSSRVERANATSRAEGASPVVGSADGQAAPATMIADRSASASAVNPDAGRENMARSIDMMVEMFEFAIETQLVAKGTTQFSGTINTLLKSS